MIPKKGEAKEVKDFRLISILNASVKIMSKVLDKRIREVLGNLIDDHQTWFLKGRSILESIEVAQEVIQFFKQIKTPRFLLKLDFQKAYDMVEWDCILETLQF